MKCQEVRFGQEWTTSLCLLTRKFCRCLLVQLDRRWRHVQFSPKITKVAKGGY